MQTIINKTKKIPRLLNKIFLIIIWYTFLVSNVFANLKNDIIPGQEVINTKEWKQWLSSILWFVRDSILGLLALIAITVFIILWAKLIMARGNPEELKKVLMQFIYSIVWLAVVALSWTAVQLVSSLNF